MSFNFSFHQFIMTEYIATAFAFLAGMAWNDAVKSTIETFVKTGRDSLIGKFIYAIIVTIIGIVVIHTLMKINNTAIQLLPDKAREIIYSSYVK